MSIHIQLTSKVNQHCTYFDFGYIKYVDNITIYAVALVPEDSALQTAAAQLLDWTYSSGMEFS
jgi:hypothetical protein